MERFHVVVLEGLTSCSRSRVWITLWFLSHRVTDTTLEITHSRAALYVLLLTQGKDLHLDTSLWIPCMMSWQDFCSLARHVSCTQYGLLSSLGRCLYIAKTGKTLVVSPGDTETPIPTPPSSSASGLQGWVWYSIRCPIQSCMRSLWCQSASLANLSTSQTRPQSSPDLENSLDWI